jgi:hypothetical protein
VKSDAVIARCHQVARMADVDSGDGIPGFVPAETARNVVLGQDAIWGSEIRDEWAQTDRCSMTYQSLTW